jgi:hypothetical protein
MSFSFQGCNSGRLAFHPISIRNSLLEKCNEAQTDLNKGNTKAAINSLNALINSVKAQSGRPLQKRLPTC